MSSSIRIVTPEGGDYRVDYLPHDTLASLRDKVSIFHSASLAHRDFFCNGKRVPENQKLQAIGITPLHLLTTSPNLSLHISVSPQASSHPSFPSSPGPSWSPNPNLQISTAYSPHTSPQASPTNVTARTTPRSPLPPTAPASRTRSGSLSVSSYNLSTPPPHPQPNSANTAHGTRRRSSLSVPPGTDPFSHLSSGPSPFDIVEQTLQKVETHTSAHPIDPTLYEGGSAATTPSSNGFSRTAPIPPVTIVIPTSSGRARSPSASPLPLTREQSSPRVREPLTPSTSSFQPVLSYRSKLTALSIALQELVDERMLLDRKTEEEKKEMDGVITEKKKLMEGVLWEGEKHVAMKAREVEEQRAAVEKCQKEVDGVKARYDEKVKELEEKAEVKRGEVTALQEEMKADEVKRVGVLEEMRSQIGELIHLRDNLKHGQVKEQEMLVRAALDLLVKAGVDLQLVKKSIDSRG